ncbi:MAG: tetratricopeptide repeat protein [Calditrichia bacterium]
MQYKWFWKSLLTVLCIAAALPAQEASPSKQQVRPTADEQQAKRQEQIKRRDQQLLRTAQTYINLNRYKEAIAILEDLHRRNPETASYYQFLLKAYLTVSEIEKAESLVRSMLEREPGNFSYQIDKATVLYKQGQKEEAIQLWDQLLNENKKNMALYTQVANALLISRLYDQAIAVYQRAIREMPNASYLYQNIANLYQNRLMYKEAAENYLKYLDIQPSQEQFIFNRILSFQLEDEQREDFFQTLKELEKKSKYPDKLRLLRAQLYQRHRQYDAAYEIYRELDQLDSKKNYLLHFAQSARQDSSYQAALQAYRLILEKEKNNLPAYIGAVETLTLLAENTGKEDYAREALNLIDQAQTRISGRPETMELNYLKAMLYLGFFFDVDQALQVLTDLSRQKAIPPQLKARSMLKLGEVYLIKGELEKAVDLFSKINDQQTRAEARYHQALACYFQQNWEKSGEIINQLIQQEGISNEVVNDALALQLKLGQAAKSPEVVEKLAATDLLLYQRKRSEAVKRLGEVLELPGTAPSIRSETFLKMAELQLQLDEPEKALDLTRRAIQDSSLAPYADAHLFLMAQILSGPLQKPAEAFESYRTLLENYPNSLHTEVARKQMKKLKEELPAELP